MRYLILVAVFSFLANFSIAKTADPVANRSLFDLVHQQDILEVSLELDMTKLLSDRRSTDSFAGTFRFKDASGTEQSWKTKVKLRGRFRRVRCSEMPPLKLNFKKGELAEAGLALHDDFKLVTQCVSDERKAKELLLKEYLAYKIYNELSDNSFRVQFLKINFKDQATGNVEQQWGFIIEDTAELRARIGAKKYKGKFGIPRAEVNQKAAKEMALFQYMIGNLDWDLYKKSHNVKVIERDGQLIPVPYDFDFSGLVSAPYAILNPNFKVTSIKDRLYLGDPSELEDMEETIALFKAKKSTIIRTVKDFKLLKRESRREIIVYLNSFYKEIDNLKLPEVVSSMDLSAK